MSKSFYLIFLSVASARDVGVLLGIHDQFVGIIYFLLLLYVVFTYFSGRIAECVWVKGLSIVGIVSLVSLVLILVGFYPTIVQKIESSIYLYVWIRSVKYLAEFENKKIEE
jgi:hypothetical protein